MIPVISSSQRPSLKPETTVLSPVIWIKIIEQQNIYICFIKSNMINIILLILAVQIHEYKILHRNKSLFIIMHKLLLYEGRDWFKALFVLQLIKRVKLDVRQKLLCKLLHLKKGIHKCFFRITCTDIHHLTVRISGYGEDKKKKKITK